MSPGFLNLAEFLTFMVQKKTILYAIEKGWVPFGSAILGGFSGVMMTRSWDEVNLLPAVIMLIAGFLVLFVGVTSGYYRQKI